MNVSIIIPVDDPTNLTACLQALLAQRYDKGTVEIIVVAYGVQPDEISIPVHDHMRSFAIKHTSPYAARNLGAAESRGDFLLFTETGTVADPDWIGAHVSHLGSGATVSVGDVVASHVTHFGELFASYERVRDAWVFSCNSPPHYFGRPKNMAIARRRFESHGPFREIARGADSLLVQKITSEISCDEVAFAPDAIVRQLSIRGVISCFHDRYGHAYALRKYSSSHAAPIALDRRIRLYRSTLKSLNASLLDSIALLLLLTVGIWVFRFGDRVGARAVSNQD